MCKLAYLHPSMQDKAELHTRKTNVDIRRGKGGVGMFEANQFIKLSGMFFTVNVSETKSQQ